VDLQRIGIAVLVSTMLKKVLAPTERIGS